MKPKFYLVTVLLETSDTCISDEHHLYTSYADAERAFNYEVAECQANFEGQSGRHLSTFRDAVSGAMPMATASQ
jgi:hypothetical protein